MEAMTRPPATCTMGSRDSEEAQQRGADRSMAMRKRTVLMAMRRAREWCSGIGACPTSERKIERGTERVDQREQRAEGEYEVVPEDACGSHCGGHFVTRLGYAVLPMVANDYLGDWVGLARGRVRVMVVPWLGPGLVAVMSPPCWRAMVRTRKRPRPVPLILTMRCGRGRGRSV